MSQLTKYAYANAKIRAMLSRLLEPGFFDSLVAARSFPEAVEMLRRTQYADALEGIDPSAPDLDRIEKRLAQFDEAAFRKVSSVLRPPESEFVLLLLEKFEVEALKVALRFWYKKPPADPARFLPDHAIVHDIDYAKIVKAQSPEELIVLLAETPYFRPLARARERFKERNSLFYLEASLDVDYYARVLESIDRFSPRDRETARRVLGIEIDIENIGWLVRLKKYYNLALGDILEWVIPGGERVTLDTVRRSYTTDGVGSILQSVALGPYGAVKTLSEQQMYLIENLLYGILLREVKRMLAGFPFSIGTVLGYLTLKRRETRNIVSILNAKHLGMKQETLAQLIRP